MQCIFSCSQASFSVEDGVVQAKANRHQHTGNHDEKKSGKQPDCPKYTQTKV